MLHISPISGSGAKLGGGWFVLGSVSDVTYAALITPEGAAWDRQLTVSALTERFHTIRYDWSTSEG